jgi:hypothetical protein
MKSNKDILEKYQVHLSVSPQASIFCRPWWLNAVAPGSWNLAFVERGDEIAAAWPYVVQKKLGRVHIKMPLLTQTLGILFRPSEAKYPKRLAEENKMISELLTKLPPFRSFYQLFHYNFTNWLPLFWQGFKQTTRYSYVLEDLHDLDSIWKGMRENIRREIRKGERTLRVEQDLDVDSFFELNQLVFKRKKKRVPYSRSFVKRLDRVCAEHNARKIFFALDRHENIHGAFYLVWDEQSAYYLMGGLDPRWKNSGVGSLLMWEGIKYASSVTKKFDFEGSMIESVERFFRGFGAVQKRYFAISRSDAALDIIWEHLFSGAQDFVKVWRRKGIRRKLR